MVGPFSVEKNICAILVEGIMINISVKIFELEAVVQKMFKYICLLNFVYPFVYLRNFGRGHF